MVLLVVDLLETIPGMACCHNFILGQVICMDTTLHQRHLSETANHFG